MSATRQIILSEISYIPLASLSDVSYIRSVESDTRKGDDEMSGMKKIATWVSVDPEIDGDHTHVLVYDGQRYVRMIGEGDNKPEMIPLEYGHTEETAIEVADRAAKREDEYGGPWLIRVS